MSLRLRLFVVAVLALATLFAVGLAVRDLLQNGLAATITSVAADMESATHALGRAFAEAPPEDDRSDAARERILQIAADVLEPMAATRGGYCFRDGDFVEAESGTFRGGPEPGPGFGAGPEPGPGFGAGPEPRPGFGAGPGPDAGSGTIGGKPPPDVRRALTAACQRAAPGEVLRREISLAGDVIVLVVQGTERGAVFAMRLVRARAPRGLLGWLALGAMPLVTLFAIAVVVDTIFALRRGVGDLRGTLARLEVDLRTEIPRPRARELAEIADQLRVVAGRLADARERERELQRKIAHQARLGSLGRLVAGVAHEIRNPLTGIKLLLDGMRRRELDGRSEKDVQTCLREVARLDRIVTSFLGIARDAPAEPATIDLGALIDERIAALPGSPRVDRSGEARVVAERGVLVQVLDNLLRNAVEAGPRDEPIRVEVREAGDHAEIDVVDRGEGVSEEHADSLFEPFFTTKASGTGLGLWLSRTLVTSRGGALRYARRGGETCFTIDVPMDPK